MKRFLMTPNIYTKMLSIFTVLFVFLPLQMLKASTDIELVDLGLSVKWASRNIDATDIPEKGGYYAWGETCTKETYTWQTYTHCSGSASSCMDIGSDISMNFSYDRACCFNTNLCLPTAEQWEELISHCTWTAATVEGVKGYNVKGPNGKSIFLPFSGCSYEGNNYGAGSYAYYWSANNDARDVSKAQVAYIKAGTTTTVTRINRRTGTAIRAVSAPTSSELIDLGLSVRWASRNIDATDIPEKGGYYSWGEISTKEIYTWQTYTYCFGSATSCMDIGSDISMNFSYDRANNYNTNLCLPTAEQWEELISQCTWTAATVEGVKGYNVKGPNGKSIFLPFSGCSYEGNNYGVGSYAYYWSANNVSKDVSKAQAAYLKSGTTPIVTNINRRTGMAIRAVSAHEKEQPKIVRLFLNDGDIVNFNSLQIDSITATPTIQKVWKDGSFTSFSTNEIDSILYISPFLKVSLRNMNFGKVAVGNKKSAILTITNTGQYRETLFLFAEGVFEAQNSGRYFSIEAGESLEMDVVFRPTETLYYSSKLLIFSSAVDNGELSIPLVGRGVKSDSEEEDFILPPEDINMDIVLSDNQSIYDLNGFKIVNSYGEFPIQIPSQTEAYGIKRQFVSEAKGVRRIGSNSFAFGSPIQKSPNGLQLHTMVDLWNNPWLFSISLPDEDRPEMSVEETAISILMTDPLLITSNEAAYRNTVQAIRDLGDVYKDFVAEVADVWAEGWRNKQCPDYSNVNISPVICALYNKVKDNSNLTLDGLSLKNVVREPDTIRYKVQNDRRRIVHIYPRRAKKAADSNVGYEKVEDATNTLQEVCQWIIEGGDKVENELKDEEYKEFIEDLKEWVGEVEKILVAVGLGDTDSHIEVPIVLESKQANYWKLVKETAWDSWVHDYDLSRSIYEVSTNEIATAIDDCDQVLVDIYGMGSLEKDWSKCTGKEKLRIIIACLHSGYKDYVKPLMDLGSGIIDAVNATGSDNYKYDFRYGDRKAPEMALLIKLSKDFASDPENVRQLHDYLNHFDFLSAVKLITSFVCDRILTCPTETDDKRTYTNLIYNIYKKHSKNSATSKKFRDNFKAVANNLTHLKNANFAAKVIKVSEAALDVSSTIKAFLISKMQNTFVINKSTDAYITVTEPTELLKASSNQVHFAWTTYKADYLDHYLYDLDLYVITPDKAIEITALKDFDGTECNLNLASILSNNGAGNAISVEFRLSGHADNNPDIIYCRTEYIPLLKLVSPDDFVFVDLGLESGVLWANRNLGAPSSSDFGNYYAWGETKGYNEGKTSFSWKNYKYCKGTSNTLTKYCTKSNYGNNNFTDGLAKLQGSDDAASSIYGYYYAIPTKEEWEELMTSCRWSKLNNGAFVRGVEGKSDNVIMLPAAGYRSGMNLYDAESEGFYWTSTLDQNSPDDAWMLHFSMSKKKPDNYDYYRCQGRSVRMVLRPKENTSEAKSINHKQSTTNHSSAPMEINGEGMVVKMVSHSANK